MNTMMHQADVRLGDPRTARGSAAGLAPLLAVLLATMLAAGCGDSRPAGDTAAEDTATADATAGGDEDRGPCALLGADEVASVLPGHDGGSIAANGGSLIKGVDSYQCSYTRVEGMDARLFTVIVHKAADDAAFEQIRPGRSMHEDDQPVEAGDAAWVYGDEDDLKLQMLKGRSIVELELMTPDAATRKDAVVELARALATRLT